MNTRLILISIATFSAISGAALAQSTEEGTEESLSAGTAITDDAQRPDLDEAEQLIVKQTNAFRRENDLKPVEVNPKLEETAQYFADYMARTQKYGHTADGQRPSERAKNHGYEYCIVSENIAYQYSSAGFSTEELANKFFTGWKESPEHRKNMLDSDVTETGVAIARSSETGYYFGVQMFGRPKSKQFQFTVTNEAGETVEYKLGDRSFTLPARYTRTHGQCRPTKITFQLAPGETTTLAASDADRFTVTKENGQLEVKTEK